MVTHVAVVSDLHGNVPALRAVMREIDEVEVDAVICCGDIVSGPLPGETLDLLRSLDRPRYCVRGNADRGAVAAFDRTGDASVHPDDVWSGRQLDREQRDFLASLPLTVTLEIDGLGPVLFCHATPGR
ncbi:MAG: metallophosphatase family protein, partial [Actinomycetota bacterium]|nr:metallophosphatase family protein [Actinomycetota bacterium]